jgi:hypothetical protein
MMKRAKGVTLDEIMETTGWQKHTVRGFVSILGNKGGEQRLWPSTQGGVPASGCSGTERIQMQQARRLR